MTSASQSHGPDTERTSPDGTRPDSDWVDTERLDITGGNGADRLGRLVAVLTAGGTCAGRSLLVLRTAAVRVRGAEGALLALDASGATVLVILVPLLRPGAAGDIADELDRLASCTLSELCGTDTTAEELAAAYASFFSVPSSLQPDLNDDQQAVVVVGEPPDTAAWEELTHELRGQLAAVCLAGDQDDLRGVDEPEGLRRQRPSPWRGPVVLLVPVAVILLAAAVLPALNRGPDSAPSTQTPHSTPRDVVAGAAAAATHNRWIGQSHLVRASDGTLLAVYGSPEGLQVVADHANQGRQWQTPVNLLVAATSSSVVIDDDDRLHVAVSDRNRVAYSLVERVDGGWASSVTVELDTDTDTPYVDVAYDEASDVVHVVWVEEGPQGQAPRWAAISAEGGTPRLLRSERLAPPAAVVPVLVNVAAAGGSPVVATYRRGDSAGGWWSRSLLDGSWQPEEQVPTDAGIGAAALVMDLGGTAHLILRDSTTFGLDYYSRSAGGPWSTREVAVDAGTIEEIDLPSLAVDRSSRLLYLFFHSDRAQRVPAVQVAVRDPVSGWETPAPVTSAEALPEGAFFPTSLAEAAGAPLVLWMTGGGAPVLQAASIAP